MNMFLTLLAAMSLATSIASTSTSDLSTEQLQDALGDSDAALIQADNSSEDDGAGTDDEPEKNEQTIADEKRDIKTAADGLKNAADIHRGGVLEGAEEDIENAEKVLDGLGKILDETERPSDEYQEAYGNYVQAQIELERLEEEYDNALEQLVVLGGLASDAKDTLREHCTKWGNDIFPSSYEGEKAERVEWVAQKKALVEWYKKYLEKMEKQYDDLIKEFNEFMKKHGIEGISKEDMEDQPGEIQRKHAALLKALDEITRYTMSSLEYLTKYETEYKEYVEGLRLHCESKANDNDEG